MRNIKEWEKALTIDETIYPKGNYFIDEKFEKPDYKTPYHVIKKELRNKNLSYFSIMESFINKQEKTSKRRGADLPFIGEGFLQTEKE
ncbi:hypothetical protein [Bacillus sp. OK048]|uniref:hypothetical protein n=1 Tax=Bacillus sp. OK048 TaxID=1882761 RepID=UPI0008819BC2|nr:hypothetical protein [Bacillus sp. OK048]SDN62249.1 hypothetical protein SAMN05443253_11524 [Bacillus sp. OK048]